MKKFICSLILCALATSTAVGCQGEIPDIFGSQVTSNGGDSTGTETSVSTPDPFDLEAYRIAKVIEVNNYFPEGEDEESYSAANLIIIDGYRTTAVNQINTAATKIIIDNAVTIFKQNVGQVKTLAMENAELQTYKDGLKQNLNNLKSGNQALYSLDNWNEIERLKGVYCDLIQNQDTKALALAKYEEGVAAINAVKTLAQELADAIAIALAEADDFLDDYIRADYDDDEWDELEQIKQTLINDITGAANIAAIETAKSDATTAADSVKTKAEKIQDLRDGYVADLEADIDLIKIYFSANAFDTILSNFATTLAGLTENDAMALAYQSAKESLDDVELDAAKIDDYINENVIDPIKNMLGYATFDSTSNIKIAFDNEVQILLNNISSTSADTISELNLLAQEFTVAIFGIEAVAAFMQAYENIVNKTAGSVTLSDANAIRDAIAIYEDNNLTSYSQISTEYSNLKALEMILDEVDEFIETHTTVFAYLDTTPTADLDNVVIAIGTTVTAFNSEDFDNVDAKRIIGELIFDLQLLQFRLKYRELLKVETTIETIADNQLSDINAALGEITVLDPTEAHLATEKTKLEGLATEINARVYITYHINHNLETDTYVQKVYDGVAANLADLPFHIIGFHFAGWNTQSDGFGDDYTDKQQVTLNTDLTLYAQWIPVTTYTFDLELNGGVMSDSSESITGNEDDVVCDYLAEPTKEDDEYGSYSFAGWYTDSSFQNKLSETATFADLNTETVTTLYAQWTLTPRTYEISVNLNGGTGVDATISGAFGDPINPGTPTKSSTDTTDYAFEGWYTDSGLTTPLGSATFGGSVTAIYAKWTETTRTYEVSVNLNGGTGVAAIISGAFGDPINPGTPTKANDTTYSYTFEGWYINSELTTSLGSATFGDGVTAIYAKWTPILLVSTITLELNGGNDSSFIISGNTGDTIVNPGTPTKNSDATYSYTFIEWCVDSELNTPLDSSHKYGAVTTLYAKWEATPIGPDFKAEFLNDHGATIEIDPTSINKDNYTTFVNDVKAALDDYGELDGSIQAELATEKSKLDTLAQAIVNAEVDKFNETHADAIALIGNYSLITTRTDANNYYSLVETALNASLSAGATTALNETLTGLTNAKKYINSLVFITLLINDGSSDISVTIKLVKPDANGDGVFEDIASYQLDLVTTLTDFVYEDHDFDSWNSSSTGSGDTYADGAILTDISNDLQLYAQWVEADDDDNSGKYPPIWN